MGCRQSVYGHNRGAEERFYIGNDRADTLWVEGGVRQRATDERTGRKSPVYIIYGLPVHSKL